MHCPYLVRSVKEIDNHSLGGKTRTSEHQEFDKCMLDECPFYQRIPTKYDTSGIASKYAEICRRASVEMMPLNNINP